MTENEKAALTSGFFSSRCPDYKTEAQFKMFIESRKIDIKCLEGCIAEAERKLSELYPKEIIKPKLTLIPDWLKRAKDM